MFNMGWVSDAAKRIFEIIRDPKLLIALFLFSLALLTLPEPVIGWFGLIDIVDEARGWISLLLFLCAAGLLAYGLIHAARAFQDRRATRKHAREADAAAKQEIADREDLVDRVIDRLDNLSDEEVAYIAAAVRDLQQTIFTHLHDPVASSLVDNGFLSLGSGGVALKFPYHFRDDIWDLLVADRDLIFEEQKRREQRR